MKPILISLFAVFISFAFLMPDAEARRMGGSKSFGMQRTRRPSRMPRRRRSASSRHRADHRAEEKRRGWVRSPASPRASAWPRCFPIWDWARKWPIS